MIWPYCCSPVFQLAALESIHISRLSINLKQLNIKTIRPLMVCYSLTVRCLNWLWCLIADDPRILMDKTMGNTLICISNYDEQNIPFCRVNVLVDKFKPSTPAEC